MYAYNFNDCNIELAKSQIPLRHPMLQLATSSRAGSRAGRRPASDQIPLRYPAD